MQAKLGQMSKSLNELEGAIAEADKIEMESTDDIGTLMNSICFMKICQEVRNYAEQDSNTKELEVDASAIKTDIEMFMHVKKEVNRNVKKCTDDTEIQDYLMNSNNWIEPLMSQEMDDE